MISKILIANRGEIALRVIRACREMGIQSVAVHSTADEDAMHVHLADESVCIGPPSAAQSYLSIPAIIAACEITGADAVHPGYGFLSENAKFADILDAHNICFIGPKADHIRLMGDKIAAKAKAIELGIPVVPGSDGEVKTSDDALELARDMGFPVLVKAASGGGGRGMKIAHSENELAEAFTTARSEAKAAFGDDAVYIEKYLEKPRHIEIQVACDSHGNAVHLGERDCSLQRRHQKVLEEAPSMVLDSGARAAIGKIVTDAMEGMQYLGVGTVEFLYEDGEFYFIEMNTRLQVEHPRHRNDYRRRPCARANQNCKWRAAELFPRRPDAQRTRHRMSYQCRKPAQFHAVAGCHPDLSPARWPWRADGQRGICRLCHTALLRQPDW